ncbi:GH1 family beta-glucosidase [Sorangium sp. KYC3313]|uniref:GH1 family beta-glucosidase n=1 Tax=Sorangium sp. KYC3313 TaxID=3449740 RepID=UPI003F8BB8BB
MTRQQSEEGFPEGFLWGAAAASYQIEGAAHEDGKGPSVWDMFCRKPDAVWNGQTGDVACDHYHRYQEDVALMRDIGLRAYRLSTSWPRVLPEGTGAVNERGLAFYDRLVDALLEAGVEPHITLFHWDFPLALYHKGGWLNRDSADWFAEYTSVVVRKLGDRVKDWMTLNEPQVFAGAGHYEGRHAPGDRLRFAEVLRVCHHVLLAHGKSVQAIRAASPGRSNVYYAPVAQVKYPATSSPEDLEAARAATWSVNARTTWTNTWWMDPVFFGRYPEDGLRLFASELPEVRSGDMEIIAQPVDFCGVNVYWGVPVRAGANGAAEVVPHPVGHPITAFEWSVTPECLYWGPRFFHERYKRPIVITENGLSTRDWISLDGKVHDPQRIDFMARHLIELRRAIAEGAVVNGYFHWSILDNFEWAHGYKHRFGLVFVDYPTGRRVLKDSAHWYRELIASNGATLGG